MRSQNTAVTRMQYLSRWKRWLMVCICIKKLTGTIVVCCMDCNKKYNFFSSFRTGTEDLVFKFKSLAGRICETIEFKAKSERVKMNGEKNDDYNVKMRRIKRRLIGMRCLTWNREYMIFETMCPMWWCILKIFNFVNANLCTLLCCDVLELLNIIHRSVLAALSSLVCTLRLDMNKFAKVMSVWSYSADGSKSKNNTTLWVTVVLKSFHQLPV